MILNRIITSKEAPTVSNAIWVKPVDGGFTIYARMNGGWKALKLVDDSGDTYIGNDSVITPEEAGTAEDEAEALKEELIGENTDAATDNTFHGLRAKVDATKAELIGEDGDASTANTFYGLRAYVDAAIAALQQTPSDP